MKLLIDAKDLEYRELNLKVRNFLNGNDNNGGSNNREVIIKNALGRR